MVSYGIDIGTTTLRAVAVEIQIGHFGERRYNPLGPALCIFTPFTPQRNLNEKEILTILDAWIKTNALPSPNVGTLLFTGEAQRAENAVSVGDLLTQKWGGLLSAQLNPELESRIAAFGSGAVEISAGSPGKSLVHIDIGGGTSNFAWIENGEITDTACLNIGCRKWILDPHSHSIVHATKEGKYISGLVRSTEPSALCDKMVDLLLKYSLGEVDEEIKSLTVVPWKEHHKVAEPPLISISGGVVECLEEKNPYRYGDVGVFFISSLKKRRKDLLFSTQEGKATALGVSAFGFQVSGGSIHQSGGFPSNPKNVPLYTESAFLQLPSPPPILAVVTDFQETDSQKIEDYATLWRKRLLEAKPVIQAAVFLFPKNIAKTFGYFLSKEGRQIPEILVLDEIQPEPCRTQVRTLDVTHTKDPDRFLVTLKALDLF